LYKLRRQEAPVVIDLPDGLREDEVDAEALRLVINHELSRHGTVAAMLWRRKPGERPGSLGLHHRAHNLLGAMWLQLADAITEGKNFRRCQVCTRSFEVGGADGARTSKRYCRPACQQRAFRVRQKSAAASGGLSGGGRR
jgi:hypothetical protein